MNHCLVLRLEGDMASWRKFYGNSSSLSYYYPPRTSVIGIIGSIMELSFAEMISRFEELGITVGIRVAQKLRKTMFTMNYRSTKSFPSEYNTYTQTKLELILPPQHTKKVWYEIYLGAEDSRSSEFLAEVENRINVSRLGYGVYLGMRSFRANVAILSGVNSTNVQQVHSNKSESIVPLSLVSGELRANDTDDIYIFDSVPTRATQERSYYQITKQICSLGKGVIEVSETIRNTYNVELSNESHIITML